MHFDEMNAMQRRLHNAAGEMAAEWTMDALREIRDKMLEDK